MLALSVALQKALDAVPTTLEVAALLSIPLLIFIGVAVPTPFAAGDTVRGTGSKFSRVTTSAG
jgi:hypothetical protein